jgi:hypothetical protein
MMSLPARDLILRSHAERGVSKDGASSGILIQRAPFEKAARHHGHAQREAGQHGPALL